MLDGRRRPVGRLFLGLLTVLLVWWGVLATPGLLVVTANAADGGSPATARVSDTVFRADGTPASGTVLISWPAFTTADAKPVAAGTKSIALASGGTLAVDLVPKVSASPTGSYYQVVFQLDSGGSDRVLACGRDIADLDQRGARDSRDRFSGASGVEAVRG